MSTNVITKSLADSSRDQASIFAAKVRIFGLIKRGALGGDVVKELLPAGQPLFFEKAKWDYKESLPTASANPTPDESKAHGAKMAEIVKDVVAFFNSHGGYLVAGVGDNPIREVANVRGIAFTATACEAAMQAIRRHRRWTGSSHRSARGTGSISR